MVNFISSISEELTKIEYEEKRIITPMLRRKNRIKTLAGTLEIEGNFLGEEKITAILNGKRVLGTLLEVSEVEGAINAYKELENYNFKSIDDLLKAHNILMNGLLITAGNFRNVNIGVGQHIAPQPSLVPGLMEDLFNWLKNTNEHPLIMSCIFHYEFEFIHPFSDGNGRIGRLWQSVILYNWKKVFSAIPTESIIRDNQEKYYEAIEMSTNIGESTPFIEFLLEVILKTIVEVGNRVGNKVGNTLTANQKKIILEMKLDPKVSAQILSDKVGISKRKIEENIAKLKNMGKIKREGGTRGNWKVPS